MIKLSIINHFKEIFNHLEDNKLNLLLDKMSTITKNNRRNFHNLSYMINSSYSEFIAGKFRRK